MSNACTFRNGSFQQGHEQPYLKPISDRVEQLDVIPRLKRPLVSNTAIESKARRIHMKPLLPLAHLVRLAY